MSIKIEYRNLIKKAKFRAAKQNMSIWINYFVCSNGLIFFRFFRVRKLCIFQEFICAYELLWLFSGSNFRKLANSRSFVRIYFHKFYDLANLANTTISWKTTTVIMKIYFCDKIFRKVLFL